MKASFILAGMLTLYVVIGLLASETGLTAPIVDAALEVPDAPSDSGGIWNTITSALAPFAWVFNSLAGIFQLVTFQVDEVPGIVNTLIFAPIGTMFLIVVVKVVRGVGE